MKIYCSLIENGWIRLKLSGGDFRAALSKLKRGLHVLTYKSKTKEWLSTIYYFDDLYHICEDNGYDLHVTEALLKYYRRFKYLQDYAAREKKNRKVSLDLWDKSVASLYKYQKRAINAAFAGKHFLIGDQMGLGKTLEAIGIILKAFQDYGFESAIIVCPARIVEQWRSQILKFTLLEEEDITVLGEKLGCINGEAEKYDGRKKVCKDCKYYEKCKEFSDNPKKLRSKQIKEARILICGYEMFRACETDIRKRRFEVFIFDEATKLKNYTSAVSRTAKKVLGDVGFDSFVIMMSGTFIENRLEEIFAIVDLVDDRIFGKYWNFKNRYLTLDMWGKVIGYRNLKEVKQKLKPILIRRTVEKVWKDRPPLIEVNRECEMVGYQKEVYEEAREGVLQQIQDAKKAKKINNAMLATLISYLLQISDTVQAIDGECTDNDASVKINVLCEILEDEIPEDSQVVIFSRFANNVVPHIIAAIEELNIGRVGKIVGGAGKRANKTLDLFVKRKKIRFLVCSDAMSYGANLQNANYIVNFDLPWNPAIVDQRIARVYRKGQHKTVTIINLIATGTIEEHLLNILEEKSELAAQVLKQSSIRKRTDADLKSLVNKI